MASSPSKPLDGLDQSKTLADDADSPRKEIVYNVEPFHGAIRQGYWKLIWRTMLPSSVDPCNLRDDPSEERNLATEHPGMAATMQHRLNSLAAGSAKPLFLLDQFKVVQKNMAGEPVLPIDEASGDPDRH